MKPTPGTNLVWRLDDELPSHDEERRRLRERGYDLVVTRKANYREDYPKYAPYAKAVLIQVSFPSLGAEDIAGLTSCKIITATGGGYNHVDVSAATRQGIMVTYVPGYCVEEVSDHVLGFILALNHWFFICQEMTRKGRWNALEIGPFRRLQTQVLGVVGFGRIGKAVARKAKCLGLAVKVYDPYIPESDIKAQGVECVPFDELVSTADYISLHVLLTKETYHLFNAKVFDSMKPAAYLINTCRGDVVDELALIHALKTKKIAGAGLDVLAKEPPDPQNPLLFMPNVIVTPHSAFISQEAMMEIEVRFLKAVLDGLEGRIPEDLVNPEVLKHVRIPKDQT
jgi:D-3-phosphoglycerate dehydrogenase